MNMTTQALQTSIKALRAITIDDNYHDAKCDTDEVYKLRDDAITLCEQALSQPNESETSSQKPIYIVGKGWQCDVLPHLGTELYLKSPNTSELEAKCKELEEQIKDRESDLAFEFKRANESEGTALVASQKYVDYCDLAETKIADLTAKVEKMREALQQEYSSYSDKTFVPKYIIEALEECE
jgi:hypothetical protein